MARPPQGYPVIAQDRALKEGRKLHSGPTLRDHLGVPRPASRYAPQEKTELLF